jgi:hypothetical protein
MKALLEMSEGLRRMLEVVAPASGWLLVMAAAACFEVLARKTSAGPPDEAPGAPMALPRALFSLWMG